MNNIIIDAHTKKLGILGWPVEHSLSPIIQNAAIQYHKINAVYLPLPCAPGNIEKGINAIKSLDFVGANVTVPHKEAVIPYLDKVDEISSFLGSVNTLYWEENLLCGTSTDPYGAFKNLYASGYSLENQNVVLLGNGGAARALAFTLSSEYGKDINSLTILGRSYEKAEKLCNEINSNSLNIIKTYAGLLSEFADISSKTTMIINTTTVGMSPNIDKTPIDTSTLRPKQIVYDIIYAPRMTKLLKDAELKECRIVTGIGMLINQGILSFEKWFNLKTDQDIIKKALELHFPINSVKKKP